MKNSIFFFLLLLTTETLMAHTLKIRFTDTNNKSGEILFAIFNDREEFPDGRTFDEGSVKVSSDRDGAEVSVELPEGDYAISVFLDENGNGKLDKNLFGIPKERFGFSRNPTILTGPPSFSKAKVKLTGDEEIKIKLITLLDQ